jgi:hypothetical protein
MNTSVIVAVIKYYARLCNIGNGSMICDAYESQIARPKNSNTTLTFVKTAQILMEQLGIINLPNFNQDMNMKNSLNSFGKNAKCKCTANFKLTIANKLQSGKQKFKMKIYAHVKTDYNYEKYLDTVGKNFNSLTKFRLSCHQLPIETGRYTKPKTPRNQRICTLCRASVGNELHAMFRCTDENMAEIREHYMQDIMKLCPQISKLSDIDKMLYLLKGHDISIMHTLCQWLTLINNSYTISNEESL